MPGIVPMGLDSRRRGGADGGLGVFRLCIAPRFGGLGLGKLAHVRHLRGAEPRLDRRRLPRTRSRSPRADRECRHRRADAALAAPPSRPGKCFPTAVFTEPDTGSDLGSCVARRARGQRQLSAQRRQDLDHACGAQRLDDGARAHRSRDQGIFGLSMFLAGEPRGTAQEPFPAAGMSGGEIEVLGYRGMKEIRDRVSRISPFRRKACWAPRRGRASSSSCEPSRARASRPRRGPSASPGRPMISACATPASAGNSAVRSSTSRASATSSRSMLTEIVMARELAYAAARRKGQGTPLRHRGGHGEAARRAGRLEQRRCKPADPSAAAAMHSIQISRVLCDARILNIFEGAAEYPGPYRGARASVGPQLRARHAPLRQ